ncbi:MAG: hypothetical protein WAQ25_00450 [Candidatus Saccharimonas sp.]
MQPEHDEQPQTWQQPAQAVPQAPYGAVMSPEQQVTVQVDAAIRKQAEEYSPVAEPIDDTSENNPDETGGVDSADQDTDEGVLVRWQASEYVQRDHTAGWFVAFGIVLVCLMAAAYFLMKSITFMILLPVMAAALVVYVKRPAAINDYVLSRKGLHVNDRLYPYSQFKSFGVLANQAQPAIVLVPRKRFQLGHTLYFPEEVGEALVDMLAARLPMKDVAPDLIDQLLSRLRL